MAVARAHRVSRFLTHLPSHLVRRVTLSFRACSQVFLLAPSQSFSCVLELAGSPLVLLPSPALRPTTTKIQRPITPKQMARSPDLAIAFLRPLSAAPYDASPALELANACPLPINRSLFTQGRHRIQSRRS